MLIIGYFKYWGKIHLLHHLACELVFRTKNQQVAPGVLLKVPLKKANFKRQTQSVFHLCIKKFIFLFSIHKREWSKKRKINHVRKYLGQKVIECSCRQQQQWTKIYGGEIGRPGKVNRFW